MGSPPGFVGLVLWYSHPSSQPSRLLALLQDAQPTKGQEAR